MSPRIIALALFCLLIVSLPSPAAAQLFSSKGFGFGGVPAQPRSMRLPRSMSMRAFGQTSPFAPRAAIPQSYGSDEDWSGNYRTLCVRMCDGYYFPISYKTTRGKLYRDAKVCEASCDCETKLFYLPSGSSDVKFATDISGQSYGRLENAFEYRLEWDQSCTCRPAPWTEPEKIRHENYAAVSAEVREAIQKRRGEALLALIEREDAKEAAQAEAKLARLRAKDERGEDPKSNASDVKSSQTAQAAPSMARAVTAPAGVPAQGAPAEAVAVQQMVPLQEPSGGPEVVSSAQTQMAAADSVPMAANASSQPMSSDVRPAEPLVKRPGSGSARARGAANKPGKARHGTAKAAKPNSRGFLQL
jgi:hypothetical protein